MTSKEIIYYYKKKNGIKNVHQALFSVFAVEVSFSVLILVAEVSSSVLILVAEVSSSVLILVAGVSSSVLILVAEVSSVLPLSSIIISSGSGARAKNSSSFEYI
jgi:hypothetical protein